MIFGQEKVVEEALVTLMAAEFAIGISLPLFNINLLSLRQAVAPEGLQVVQFVAPGLPFSARQ
mgnify:CR=1 FL=1